MSLFFIIFSKGIRQILFWTNMKVTRKLIVAFQKRANSRCQEARASILSAASRARERSMQRQARWYFKLADFLCIGKLLSRIIFYMYKF